MPELRPLRPEEVLRALGRLGFRRKQCDFGLRISNFGFEVIGMNKEELEDRTKAFALKIVRFVSNLPKNKITDVLGYQLLKSGTFIGANYREANRAESRDDG